MAEIFTADDIDFAFYEHETDAQQKVKSAPIYIQELMDRVHNPIRSPRALMPWRKTHQLFQFRPGEVTVWGGTNGTGKSLITGQVALSLCAQNEKVCIASFEMKPLKTLERMARQYSGQNPNDPAFLHMEEARDELVKLYAEFRDWSANRLWLYDQQGTVTAAQVTAVARWCAKEKGVTHFFIDSLMKCVNGEDDYNGQKNFMGELTAIARDYSMHIHLVHHVRKPKDDKHMPSKHDFKGSGAVQDQADNTICFFRDKEKERKVQAGIAVNQENEPDTKLVCDKQRNGDWEGIIGLWFDRESTQFVGSHGEQVRSMGHHPEDL